MITVRSISKSFGHIQAIKNVSFNINKGEIFGILGPNGAGKSTIVNILNTLVKPDKGDVIIDGVNIADNGDTVKLIMGVVPQEIALYEELSGADCMIFQNQSLRQMLIRLWRLLIYHTGKMIELKPFRGE
jgi:ABC-2 type transport system ATP-binding protein